MRNIRWHGRLRSVSRGRLIIAVCLFGLATAACNVLSNEDQRREPDVFDKVRSIDLLPRFPQPTGATSTGRADGVRPATYLGTGGSAPGDVSNVVGAQQAAGGEGYELNFENTPVTGVAKVVLGDILQVGYLIDPRVQGTVTLASGRPVPKNDLVFVLESALRVSGASLVKDRRGYVIMPASDAVGSGGVDTVARGEPGFGITAIPLQYVSAATLTKLLDSFATRPGSVRVDTARNIVLIQGNGPDRRNAVETVLSFDADWMRGQSVGIYPVRNSTPEPVIGELERIMDAGEGGLSQSLVKLQPIARLNAIMVITSKPALLKTAATWIARLDKSDAAATGVKVYQLRYGEARQIAQLLNDIFGGGRTGGAIDSATNQIAPGAGVATSTSSMGQQTGLQLPGARTQPGASSSDSRLSGTANPVVGIGGAGGGGSSPNDIVSNRSGPFGRTGAASPGTLGGGGFGGGATGGQGQGILPGVRITADAVNNTLLIYANQENYRLIEQTIRQLDRPQLQVAIDATIAEITLNENLNYGVQAFLASSDVGAHPDKGSALVTAGTSAILSRTLPGFNFLLGAESQPTVILNALRGVSDVKVLSTPSVVVLDNQVATLQVGDQVPVATASATVLTGTGAPVVNTIDYRNTGVILRVVPRINANGNVLLDIEQEISNVAAGSAGSLTPTVSQRRVKSSIAVASGQTVLLAGLISEREDNQRTGIPIIDQLPIGNLLGNTTRAKQRTELIIFIRPQIIRDGVDAMRVAEELRTKLRGRLGTSDPRFFQK